MEIQLINKALKGTCIREVASGYLWSGEPLRAFYLRKEGTFQARAYRIINQKRKGVIIMASVRKREGKRGVSWVIDYKEPPTDEYPKGKRIRLSGFKTKKSAEQELGKRVSLIGENRYLDVKKEYTTILGQLIDDYSENHKHQASFRTAKFHFLRRIREHFGEKTLLANITYKDLETYRNYLRNTPTKFEHPREASSINAELSCLNHLFTKAKEWDMIEISPFSNGKSLRLKVDNERTRFLAEDEIERLLTVSPVWDQNSRWGDVPYTKTYIRESISYQRDFN